MSFDEKELALKIALDKSGKNSMAYWYPKIEKLPIPQPLTVMTPLKVKYSQRQRNFVMHPSHFNRIKKLVSKNFKYPIFIRGDGGSGKHDWKETCYVKRPADLLQHILNVYHWHLECDVFGGMQCNYLAIREFIQMDSMFTAFFGDMPVNPEIRVFADNGKILCWHWYWVRDAIYRTSVENWKELLSEKTKEVKANGEIKTVKEYARQVAQLFSGYWSIDFCRAKSGRWYLIDMALGLSSWHKKGCHIEPEMYKKYAPGVRE